MSRTDKNLPYHVKVFQDHVEDHDHRFGECDLPEHPFAEGSIWRKDLRYPRNNHGSDKCKKFMVKPHRVYCLHKANKPNHCLRNGVWVPRDSHCEKVTIHPLWWEREMDKNIRGYHESTFYEYDTSIPCICDERVTPTNCSWSKAGYEPGRWHYKPRKDTRNLLRRSTRMTTKQALHKAKYGYGGDSVYEDYDLYADDIFSYRYWD